jgi:23S rRNA (uridine2552-2'-O)-methyltransferase
MTKKKGSNLLIGGRAGENIRVRNKGKKSKSSVAWLERQLNDPYVRQAQKEGYRSRAVYKLKEIDETFDIFHQWQKIVDLGCAPGSWSEYVVEKLRRNAMVVGVDLQEVEPLDGAVFIQGDFNDDEVLEKVEYLLDGKADIVMSDMAASATGHSKTDHLKIMVLLELALDFAINNLREDGHFIAKVLQGGAEKQLLDSAKKHFKKVKHYKPAASRKDSSEIYLIALGFRKVEGK